MARLFSRSEVDSRRDSFPVNIALLVFVIAAFILGGGARSDVTSLLLLRPFAIAALAIGLLALSPAARRSFRALWVLGGASAALVLLHLLPLPPAIWSALPGREVVSNVFDTTGIARDWQPLSIDPFAGWNSLFSMVVPAAALVLVAACGERASGQLGKLLCVLVFVSGFLGVLQVIGGPSNGLYFYRVTNWESATGLFANRNHNAMFLACGFPLLAAWASGLKGSSQQQRAYGFVAAVGALALLPMILLTESRAGILIGAVGVVAAAFIYRRPVQGAVARGAKPVRGLVAAGLAAVATSVVILLSLTGRSTTIDRLVNESVTDDLRFAALPHVWNMALEAFPFGWGAGSFVTAYKIVEPDHLLSQNYLNHAHNDLLEAFAELGIFGLGLVGASVILYLVAAKRLWSQRAILSRTQSAAAQRIRYGFVGLSILAMLGVGSLFDYPLRVPSLMVLAAISAGFVVFALDAFRGHSYGEAAVSNAGQGVDFSDTEEGSKA